MHTLLPSTTPTVKYEYEAGTYPSVFIISENSTSDTLAWQQYHSANIPFVNTTPCLDSMTHDHPTNNTGRYKLQPT